ncbi:hypothetical protein T07_5812 [Trichinella nelsoni]|uniref:Uncharacterized protein n=1 Tax=Trichinella nelsoni TaxID=6336 RepID=A0A0V0SES3_9BILA|nr:hypothetical protein T07_5812 [Trichinella nelsoni]
MESQQIQIPGILYVRALRYMYLCVAVRRFEKNASGRQEFFAGCWSTAPIAWSDASTMRAYSAVGWGWCCIVALAKASLAALNACNWSCVRVIFVDAAADAMASRRASVVVMCRRKRL